MFNFLKPTWMFMLLEKNEDIPPLYLSSSKAWTLQGAIDNLDSCVLDMLNELLENDEVQAIVCHLTYKHFVIKDKLWTKSKGEKLLR